jgi:AcrR family transcriptional regulator
LRHTDSSRLPELLCCRRFVSYTDPVLENGTRSAPQTRTPRAVGMEHMVSATVRLLYERHPDQITVRDVAEAAGHHHRFVQAWFGGKVGLLRAAFDRLLEELATTINEPHEPNRGFRREVYIAASLLNWLMAVDPESLDQPRPTPIIDKISDIYRANFGLDDQLSRLMALRLVGGALSAILFGSALGITTDDLNSLRKLEFDLAGLLAKSSTPTV